MNAKTKRAFLKHLTDRVNDLDYSEIDCFCDDNELTEDEISELQSMMLKVIIDE